MAYTVCYYKEHLTHKDFIENGKTIEKLNSIGLNKYLKIRKYDNLEGSSLVADLLKNVNKC